MWPGDNDGDGGDGVGVDGDGGVDGGANDDVGGDELTINISQVWPAKVLVGASPVFDW